MGRLISEDDVMRMLTGVELNNGTITDAKIELRNVKTAYDISKVVAELEKQSYEIRLEGGALIGNWHSVIDTNIAIAKVRKGGVE